MMNTIFRSIRLIPREGDNLDSKSGAAGEIFYDKDATSLRIFDGILKGGRGLALDSLSNVSNSDFVAKATAAGVTGGGNVTVSVSSTAPVSPSDGNLWFNSTTEVLYVYVEESTEWIQPIAQSPDLSSYATINYVSDTLNSYATQNYVTTNLANYATQNYVLSSINQRLSETQPFQFSIAGDDSTQRTITSGNLIKFLGTGSVNITTDDNGVVTIDGTSTSTGNITFVGSTIDSSDSSSIVFTPSVIFSSDITVQNEILVDNSITVTKDINVLDNIIANNIIVSGEISSQGSGVPEIVSDNEILLDAGTRVEIVSSPIKLASFSSAARDLLTASNGDMIYNTTTNKFQGRANGVWVDLH